MKKLLLFLVVVMFFVTASIQAQDAPKKDSTFSAKVWPNPNYGLFHAKINSLNAGTFSFSIYDMLGRLIYEKKDLKAGEEEMIDLNYIPILSGLYYIKIFNKEEGVIVLKTQIKTSGQ